MAPDRPSLVGDEKAVLGAASIVPCFGCVIRFYVFLVMGGEFFVLCWDFVSDECFKFVDEFFSGSNSNVCILLLQ